LLLSNSFGLIYPSLLSQLSHLSHIVEILRCEMLLSLGLNFHDGTTSREKSRLSWQVE
jgi:hypothetical protein